MGTQDFKEKFIGFVDILGFKNMVKATEEGTGKSLSDLIENCQELGTLKDRENFTKYGPTTCPKSTYIQRDLDFQVSQFSDCVIVSTEVSPAGLINLVDHCWSAAMKLLSKGIMVRGYITCGPIYHEDNIFIGSGYHHAYEKERTVTAFKHTADERGTPFIEIDPIINNYVKDHGDNCVKEMFSRYVKGDGSITAIFPFQRLTHSFSIGGFDQTFDPKKEKQSNQILREWIENFKCQVSDLVDTSNPSAVSKAKHYISALDDQLQICDDTDESIDMLSQPYPAHRMKDFFK